MKEIKRRLAAVMFTDIVGYTAMMQKDEVIAAKLRDRHREVFRKYTEKYDGEILQYYGDGTLSIYPSSSAAVECAVEIQRELKQAPVIPLRIGIHTGEISFSDEDIYGDGVNVASRIEGLCVPGGIFISEKVYDDIKNNRKFRTTSLGRFSLKNVMHDVGIFAVANEGISTPEQFGRPASPKAFPAKRPRQLTAITPTKGRRKKFLAGLLAIFLGIFGTHRFYLGQKNLGMIYLAFTLAALFVIPGLDKLIPVIAVVSFIDGILLWSGSRADFDAKYNSDSTAQPHLEEAATGEEEHKSLLKTQFEKYKDQAMVEYREYDYDGAIAYLKKAAEIKQDDPEVHFMLARCYSLAEEAEHAIYHLDSAVAFGLKDQIRILTHEDLAHLRTTPLFDAFAKNGYRMPAELPPAQDDLLQSKSHLDADLLEQLSKLEALREKGVLTEEEFQRLKPGNNGKNAI
jgi:class 3 adenylate cyclase/tetratricopeptide (TPR) repeat protein